MVPIHFTTGTAAVAATKIAFTDLWGICATDAKDATYYVKICWQGNSNTVPVPGTTTPSITFAIQVGAPDKIFKTPLTLAGPMYYWVTLNPADSDATVLATGGDVVTLLVG